MKNQNNSRMRREALSVSNWSNPGLFFDRGFETWIAKNDKRGEEIGKHVDGVCKIDVPQIYKHACHRWLCLTADNNRFAQWFGKVDGRLYIGLGMPHTLEMQVTRHPTYGMPYIPGSALKGLARATAVKFGLPKDVIEVLFGNSSDDPDKADSGYLIFHDGWWLPEGVKDKPYVQEIVTVHTEKYYQHKGDMAHCPHPDLESPNPNHQIAVHGSFYFVVEGLASWADIGMNYLKQALIEEGIGGKITSGYGYFADDTETKEKLASIVKNEQKRIQERLQVREKRLAEIEKEKRETLFTEQERLVDQLEKMVAVTEGKVIVTDQEKSSINKVVNEIIGSNNWSLADREQALRVVEHAYAISLPKKKLEKKMGKVQLWVKAADVGNVA